jgi:hypothetical protein
MTTKTNIFILIILTFSSAYGQKPKVKKEIKITSTFDYNYIIDGKHYLSSIGKVMRDTLTTEYHQDGTISYQSNNPNLTFGKSVSIHRDSLILISNVHNLKHQRAYWSDATSIDIYTQIFPDSTVQIVLSKGDTIRINKCFSQNGKLIKCYKRELRPGYYGSYDEIIIYDIKTEDREVATVMITSFPLGLTDTFKIDNNMKTKVYKQLVYNKYNKEWYEKETTQLKRRIKIKWETVYNHYSKMYFTTRTTINYNKYELPISEEKYDTNLKHIETLMTYEYEYY